ncbi:MAG: methionyl-tRNA formyltransferase [Phycisphaerales bacterium]|nr:methionyl-tRNA formyltransferase [Phycisphaerales bacterium]
MRVVLIASGEFALPTLAALHTDPTVDIPLVVTSPDRPGGRGRRLLPTPVKTRAAAMGIPVVDVEDINEPDVIKRARECRATVGLVIAFGQKIRVPFRGVFSGGCVNLHASLLPKYRGAAPFQWAIIRGETETGVTVFHLVDRMDAGPILATRRTTIGESETSSELHDRLAELGPDAVRDVLDQFDGGAVPAGRPQDDSLATRAPKFTKQDGRIGFDRTAAEVVAWINGLWSWPGATCRYVSVDGQRQERVTLARARRGDGVATGEPGAVDSGGRIHALDGTVALMELKPEGGRVMEWRAFVNGRTVQAGDHFERITE